MKNNRLSKYWADHDKGAYGPLGNGKTYGPTKDDAAAYIQDAQGPAMTTQERVDILEALVESQGRQLAGQHQSMMAMLERENRALDRERAMFVRLEALEQ